MRFLFVATFLLTTYAAAGNAAPSDGGIDRGSTRLHSYAFGKSSTADRSMHLRFTQKLHAVNASGVLLDWNTGAVLAVEGKQNTATPGSLLKPFLLTYALQHGIADANTKVYCRRTLRVAGRPLPCSHPNSQPLLDAEGALAASCNTWFAALVRRMSSQELRAVLAEVNVPHVGRHFENEDTRVLAALGLQDVTATPMQIATAYRTLLVKTSRTGVVWNGLRDSVAYGMANNARLPNAEVLGKTGTASNQDEWWTHGWFAGGVPGQVVLVVYVPRGDGGTAAALAGAVLERNPAEGAR